jgi:hypothetical protein
MAPKITNEMRHALRQRPGEPLAVEDDQTQKVYFLVDRDQARSFFDDWLRRELQIGFDQSDRGESELWDIQKTLAEAHRRHSQQQQQQ